MAYESRIMIVNALREKNPKSENFGKVKYIIMFSVCQERICSQTLIGETTSYSFCRCLSLSWCELLGIKIPSSSRFVDTNQKR